MIQQVKQIKHIEMNTAELVIIIIIIIIKILNCICNWLWTTIQWLGTTNYYSMPTVK